MTAAQQSKPKQTSAATAATHPAQFDAVSVVSKANVYFDGKVVSHTVLFPDGTKKTLGLIYPGTYTFSTQAAENMAIVDGTCRAKVKGASGFTTYGPGSAFDVPADSSFEIAVDTGIAQYICSFIA